jgi:hypothetical protein
MDITVRILSGVVGAFLIAIVLDSALRTFVVPRGIAQPFTRLVVLIVRALFMIRVKRAKTYEQRDSALALYGPVSLLILPASWLVMIGAAGTLFFRAEGVSSWRTAFESSGSSLFTLGFERPSESIAALAVSFGLAALGLALLALLISFLPTIYGVYSRREVLVTQSTNLAGIPPSVTKLVLRAYAIGWLDDLDDNWNAWEFWFAELEETHTSFAILPFFRSSQSDRSWITAAGAMLDSAGFIEAAVAGAPKPHARLCIRAGSLALGSIADYFQIPHDADPAPDDPITIARAEFDDVCDDLAAAGVPLIEDRDQAWRDFAGWRVNYDAALVGIAALVMAPYAPWSSDRSVAYRRPKVFRRRSHG